MIRIHFDKRDRPRPETVDQPTGVTRRNASVSFRDHQVDATVGGQAIIDRSEGPLVCHRKVEMT